MIEVEKNFDLGPGGKKRLVQGAQFVGQKSFTDIYYDTATYILTSKDYWLRTREGKFELKVPLTKENAARRPTDQYRELVSDDEIAEALGIKVKTTLVEALAARGYKPFATIVTKRERYRKDGFTLDFDAMDFGYTTCEVERMVHTVEEAAGAEAHILGFAKKHGIAAVASHGKVIEYILRNNPRHYSILVARGVVEE